MSALAQAVPTTSPARSPHDTPPATVPGNGLSGWRWEKARQQVLKNQTYCGVCAEPVDHNLKWPDPQCGTVDHIIPLSRGGEPYDLANLRLVHKWCNESKGNGVRQKNPTSRRWLTT